MKVLYYHQHFSTPAGAASGRSYEFARRLIQRGHSVTIVCGSYGTGQTGLKGRFVRGQRRGLVDGIEIIELELPYSNRMSFLNRTFVFLTYAFRGINVALREKCDIVFATSTPLTVAIPAIVATKVRRIPMVFEVRDLWPELPREMGVINSPVLSWAMSFVARAAYRSARGCIGLAPGIVEGIVRQGGKDGSTLLIPNGCDLDLFSADKNAGGRSNCFTAVYTGTLGLANGLDAILDAAAVLKGRGRDDIRIVLIGDGAKKDHLMRRAHTEALMNCEFREPVSRRLLANELQTAGAGLQVLADVPGFYFGTSPNKFFDYLASGIPVITNTKGWIANLITDNNCGFATPPKDAVAFADALEYLADNSLERKKMGVNARLLAETQFDRAKLADDFVMFLESMRRL